MRARGVDWGEREKEGSGRRVKGRAKLNRYLSADVVDLRVNVSTRVLVYAGELLW